MLDATADRSTESPGPPPSETPRRTFHVLLGAILVPVFAVPIVWAFAAFWMKRAADPESRRWARRILGLAVLDTVIAMAIGLLVFGQGGRMGAIESRSIGGPVAVRDRVIIGIGLDDSFAGPGARVASVLAGGPAAEAGVKAGDVILRLGGEEIDGIDTLQRVAGAQPAGIPVALEWKRDGESRRADVVPMRASQLPRPPPTGAEAPADRSACFSYGSAAPIVPAALVLALLGMLAVLAGRQGSGSGVWWTMGSLAGGLGGAFLAASGSCVFGGGRGGPDPILALWGSTLGVLGVALLGVKCVGTKDEPSPRAMRWTSALALACWYAITGGLRLAVLLTSFVQLAMQGEPRTYDLGGALAAAAGPSAPDLFLLALPIVLFGPVGEELAFRGLLQPALARRWGPGAALAITSVLFAALHWQYGVQLPLVLFGGAVLGWARFASGGLRAPVLLHMLVNAVAFLALLRGLG